MSCASVKHVLMTIFPFFEKVTTLGELIQLSEHKNNFINDSENDLRETTFGESSRSVTHKTLTRQISSDPKLEKKVTFARLFNKISAEINNGSDFDVSL